LNNEGLEHCMQREIENVTMADENTQSTGERECVVGVDLGGTNLRLALADLSGTILTRWSSSTVGQRGHEAIIQRIGSGVKCMLEECSIPREALRSIAIGVPGVTDTESGIVVATSYLMGWRDVPLRLLMESELNIPIVVDNDVNMAAIGEQWVGSARDVKDFVFIALGTGIGAGIVLNGNLYRGSTGTAGEVGYMLLPGASKVPTMSEEPGALESMIGGEGIKVQWQKLGSAEELGLNATEIFDLALDGNPRAQTLLHKSATMLAQAIYNISLILNCPLFVLGGTVGLHPAFCAETQRVLDQWIEHGHPRLVRSSLGTDAQLLGALRSALDSVRHFNQTIENGLLESNPAPSSCPG
jgi:glucokinase